MLAVPTKKTKSSDWASPLREYIAATYGEKVADEQTESLAKLGQAREFMVSMSTAGQTARKIDQADIDKVKAYLRMLGAVEARFPIKETHVNITFTWYDSFKPAKKFMHHRLQAERAAVIFNYAAMESFVGMFIDRSNEEGNQKARVHFLTAASYFEYLRDTYLPNKIEGPVTSDMSHEGLSMLRNLMLAQAQVCIFERALRAKMSSSVLAKLAGGAKDLYYAAMVAAQSQNLSEIIDKTWTDHMSFQLNCLEASSTFHYSKILLKQADETGEGYGARIAYLNKGVGICNQVLKAKDRLSPAQISTIEGLKTAISKDLGKATQDNNQIYMDVVPDISTLPDIESATLAKVDLNTIDPLLVEPILPGASPDKNLEGTSLFESLLPAEVQMAVAMFQSSVTGILEKARELVNSKEKNVTEALAGANLPAAMEAAGGERGVPDAVWSRILETVHQNGGVSGLKAVLLGNGKVADQLSAILYTCEQKLAADEANDIKQRQIWNTRWTIPPAGESNAMIKKDVARFKGFLAEAKESDRMLLLKLDSAELGQIFEDISKPKSAIDSLMPDPGKVDDDAAVEALRSKLSLSYINLQRHVQDVRAKLESFKYKTSKANIVSDLYKGNSVISGDDEVKEAIEEKMASFQPDFDEIARLADENSTLLNRVLTDNAAYLAARRENAATKERELALQRLDFGIEKFTEMKGFIEGGKAFYASVSEKIHRLQTVVQDHILTREMMAKDMETILKSGGGGVGYATNGMVAATHQQPSFPTTMQTSNFGVNAVSHAPAATVTTVPVVPVVTNQMPATTTPTPTPQPTPAVNNELSLFEQMKQAQLEAEKQGTLAGMVGTELPPSTGPTSTPNDDAQAAATAMALEQQEILAAIQTRNAIKESRRTDFAKELNEVKGLLGDEYPDKLIMSHLKVTHGNVQVTVSNLLDGITPKQAGKKNKKQGGGGFGFFGRNKNKKNTGGNPPATGGGSAPAANVW